ncbi:hypothetical protein CAP31_03065 [Sulfuriferula sp. AH1]|uniref:hypothetical protein n=1 Tax=Sulfuriferula sp. AH1 TaxID=1985873 RepID=UPI000B3B915E|nr:hypothetical protein [Sulfuriferula sp. AH1]ARU30757.1 hypothetical protein CAP31_03065 [Sulfuriferula sp. AH1]
MLNKSFSIRATSVVLFALASFAAVAKPVLVYQFGSNGKVIGINALVGIEEPMVEIGDNCDQRIADLVVDDVVYERSSETISGFRAKKPAPNEINALFTIDSKAVYGALPNASRRDVQKIISKGSRLIVVYQVCGSGGYFSVRDIFKKGAVNNP